MIEKRVTNSAAAENSVAPAPPLLAGVKSCGRNRENQCITALAQNESNKEKEKPKGYCYQLLDQQEKNSLKRSIHPLMSEKRGGSLCLLNGPEHPL